MSVDDGAVRNPGFARNPALEEALADLARAIEPLNDRLVRPGARPSRPVVFVVGGPRSGSTLAMQLLAASGSLAYPTNLLGRFAASPALGARVQRLLLDPAYDHQGELSDIGAAVDFDSLLGKTVGVRQPNEFWYFWRRFFPVEEPRPLTAGERDDADVAGFVAELAAVEEVLDAPLALKAQLLEMDLDLLDDALDATVFVDVRRRPLFHMQSLLEARRRFSPDGAWWSSRPPGASALDGSTVHRQVAGQALLLRRHLDALLGRVAPGRRVGIDYEQLCAAPDRLLAEVGDRFRAQDHRLAPPSRLPTTASRDVERLPDHDLRLLRAEWEDLGGGALDPVSSDD